MAKKIRPTETSQPTFRDVDRASRRIEPIDVAIALGADEPGRDLGLKGSPVTVFQLRAELANRLQSSGGRPALEGATRRVKIPVTDRQWRAIEELAQSLSDQEFCPSAGQVASVLISLSLPTVQRDDELIRGELASPAPVAIKI